MKLYRFLTNLLAPLILIYFGYRLLKGKEDRRRFRERLGAASAARPAGKLIWFHAASVGEATSIIALIEALIKKFPQLNILVTTGTKTSANIMQQRLPAKVIHQFAPIDLAFAVRKFVEHWYPDTAVWVESELWPNMINFTHKSGAKMLLVNSRISGYSYKFWRFFGRLAREILGNFDRCLPQSYIDFERLENLGAKNLLQLGNLKFAGNPLPVDAKKFAEILPQVKNRKIFLAASTHPGEEEIIAAVHKKIAEKTGKSLLTIIVPRHANRGDALIKELGNSRIAQRSRNEKIAADSEIYLADTMGELGLFYRLADVVFMGGSLVPHGGQNPLEPALLECAIITGPHHKNFAQIYDEMRYCNAVKIVNSAEELAQTVAELFAKNLEILKKNFFAYVKSKAGIIDDYVREIGRYVT